MPDACCLPLQGLHDRQKAHVKKQYLVFGVIGDPGDLVRVQARIQGVQHAPAATHAEIQFQMAVAVPGQRGNPVAEGQVQCLQRIGDLARADCDLPVVAAVNIAFDPARNDLALRMVALGEINQ